MNPKPEQRPGWSRGSDTPRRSSGRKPPRDPNGAPKWGRLAALFAVVVVVILAARWLYPGEMSQGQTMALVYLLILVAVLGGSRALWSHIPMSKMLRYGAIWAGILLVAVGVGSFWEDLGFGNNGVGGRIGRSVLPGMATTSENGEIIIAKRSDGHFYLAAEVNGARVLFLVDTGATQVALTAEDAERAGIRVSAEDFYITVQTANGEAKAAPVTIEAIAVGDLVVRDVKGHVGSGGMGESLLGMTFLERFESYEVRGSQMYLRP